MPHSGFVTPNMVFSWSRAHERLDTAWRKIWTRIKIALSGLAQSVSTGGTPARRASGRGVWLRVARLQNEVGTKVFLGYKLSSEKCSEIVPNFLIHRRASVGVNFLDSTWNFLNVAFLVSVLSQEKIRKRPKSTPLIFGKLALAEKKTQRNSQNRDLAIWTTRFWG